jgi:hypothetical protein
LAFPAITDRFAGLQAEWLNVHADFTLAAAPRPSDYDRRSAPSRPRYPRAAHRPPVRGSPAWRSSDRRLVRPPDHAVLTSFDLSEKTCRLNQLRYDLRKLKGHGLIERDGSRYTYRLTQKGVQVALLFLFFHKRLCGPLANSRFHHRPDPQHRPNRRLEAAYHRADAIQRVVDLLPAP